ncbi:MAG: 50S ribosomal protein L31 [Herpetosiphonaceae bacterium]|nr:50S ribosomal protein L31 [Herpetosiphonaceae bacterium]
MKQDIHPKYQTVQVTCMTCGTQFETRSTRKELRVDVCSKCHPFYSGEQRLMDTAGQVDRFMKRLQTTQTKQSEAARKTTPAQPPKKSLYQEVFGEEKSAQ